ncbi:MAG: aspartate aminotransferase family protein [Gemmatimonadaceae bacterium]|nr:aspartate aminotransferase family protein [Gemmatimonadaceae bacterium]NUO95780.1 aspartate aminotransferase family protein [Gemmatimonadaceae bacterium]NUP71412.1 aspartate aminotransferase family protein [Gemmatimonadaceae bacterium]NUS34127.1 aspartate aminotransferase family protein [Gemmatimonadaceae bacterium]
MPETTHILAALESDMELDAALRFTTLTAEYLSATRSGDGPVSTPRSNAELAARFDEPMPLDGRPLSEVIARLRDDVLPDCNRLYHPRYVGHQVSAPLPAAIWTESFTAALNQSVAVAEMSPTGTALEHRVVRWLCELVGYGPTSGGTLTSGGTEATLAGLLAARAAALPDAWTNGVGADPPVVVCGEHAHYAVARAVGEMGIGMRNAVVVPSRDWRMDVDALRATLDRLKVEGRGVMAVVATAGSTATGSFDDLEAIGALCEERGLWLHVDGAHGASALLSERHRHRVRGLARARSIAWDPHKMMLLPLSAGVVLVRDERDLEGAFSQRAPYLFHGGEGERVVDQGVRSLLCSRRADVFKLWVSFQRYGARGLGALYDRLCDVTQAMHDRLAAHRSFEVLHAPECNILCFRWIGDGTMTAETLDVFNRQLRERYNRSGAGWITATNLAGRRVLRVTIMNPRTGPAEVDEIIAGIARMAEEDRVRG